MRFLALAVFSLFISANAYAVPNAEIWQEQLQSQIRELQAQSPSLKPNGEVSVVSSRGGDIIATLPSFTLKSPDGSVWTIPSVVMQGRPMARDVAIKLPSVITRKSGGSENARLVFGTQTLNAHWNDTAQSLESLNGILRNVSFNDTKANVKSTIANIAITANKGAPVQIIATDIRNILTQEGKALNNSVAKATIAYQMPTAGEINVASLIGYFNPAMLLAEGKEVVFSITAEQVSLADLDGRTTSLQKLVSKINFRPQGKNAAAKIDTQAFIVSQNPPSPYSFVLPRQADLSTTITNLPLEMVSLSPELNVGRIRRMMDSAGSVINISKLNVTTFDGAKLNGTGSVKADNSTPAGFVGRITLKLENLKEQIANSQMMLLQPANGDNRSGRTQGLMAMMMLQGMGKQEGNNTIFVLDLTADGQTLVNGQDLSGLVGPKNRARTIETVPSLPVEKVKSSNL